MSLNFQGALILAPLTKGGNLPFRRLCRAFGADITVSEMAYARQLLKGEGREKALLRRHPSEEVFGVQIAAGRAQEAAQVTELVAQSGADFIDLNVGCPIHDAVRRGMGSCLLQRPRALATLVAAMVERKLLPVTVKIRAGWSADTINAPEVAKLLAEAGATAITLHARTREQRYTKSADWGLVRTLVQSISVPIVGNGDVLTWYEAHERWGSTQCAALMVGRGAMIKPWIFREIKERSTWNPTVVDRVGVYYQLASFSREHFRDDEKGKKRVMYFLPFQIGFLNRFRYLPESRFLEAAKHHPLIQTRLDELMEDALELSPIEQLLRDGRAEVHERIASVLWAAHSEVEAYRAMEDLASQCLSLPEVIEREAPELEAQG